MREKIMELLELGHNRDGFGELADEFMELLQTEGWVKMRSKSQARRVRLQLDRPIMEVGDNSLVTEEEE